MQDGIDDALPQENISLHGISWSGGVILVIKTIWSRVGRARPAPCEIDDTVLTHRGIALRVVRYHPVDDLLRRVAQQHPAARGLLIC